MKIGINSLPLKNSHKYRGIGYYTSNLIDFLKKDEDVQIVEFTNSSKIEKVDLVHYPWFDFYIHSLPIKKTFKTIVTIHDVIPLKFPSHYPLGFRGRVNYILQRIALKNVKAVITDSISSKKDIINFLKLNEEKIFPIPLAVGGEFKILTDTKLIHARNKFHLPNQFLLYVGDANKIKNIPFLIEGFYKLLQKIPELKLVLVGGVFLKNVDDIDHPELESLKKVNRLIKELNLENKITRVGYITNEELVAFYNLATVYIQPSLYEGFGLPVLQAFSCGTPVISSNGGSLPEVGGDAALYFDPSNMSQFINITEEVLTNKSLQNKLSTLSFKRAEKFSWKKVIEQTKNVYQKVLNE